MAQEDLPEKITSFDELIEMYEWGKATCQRERQACRWLSYLLRRTSMLAGLGLIFFGVCLALTMTDTFGTKEVNKLLHGLRLFDAGCRDEILLGSIALLLLRTLLPYRWFVDKKAKTWRTTWSERWEEPITLLLLSGVLLSGFSWIIAQSDVLFLGLVIFAPVTLGALLVDRTLGFTRRNERYQLFANRAEGLIVESRSRKAIPDKSGKNIQFNEEHLLDCSVFFEGLRQDKHNATMSDSFYILRLKEQILQRTI